VFENGHALQSFDCEIPEAKARNWGRHEIREARNTQGPSGHTYGHGNTR
jgi:hypothetical protein